jgi:hypothetical protein
MRRAEARERLDHGVVERTQLLWRDHLAIQYGGARLSQGPRRDMPRETPAAGHTCFQQRPGAAAYDPDGLSGCDEVMHERDHGFVARKLSEFTIPGTMSNASYSSTVA